MVLVRLVLILILAAFLRFWQLGEIPPGLTTQEAIFGYNAFSLSEISKISLKESFSFYPYASILPIKFFSLSEFSTRFASAFFGTSTVLLIYFLVRKLFGKEKSSIAEITTFLLAISPWHIHLSRFANDSVLNLFLIVSLAWWFLKKGKKCFLMVLFLFFAITFLPRFIQQPFLFLKNYFDQFNFAELFINDNLSKFYLFSLVFLLNGFYQLIKNKQEYKDLIFVWFLVAPLSEKTFFYSLPIWLLIIAYGIIHLKRWFVWLLCFLIFLEMAYFSHNYFAHYSMEAASEWQYGYREAINIVDKLEKNYQKIAFSRSLSDPYVFFLFYKQYPPERFRDIKNGFDKYQFGGWQDQEKGVLFVTPVKDVPDNARVFNKVNSLDENLLLVVFDQP